MTERKYAYNDSVPISSMPVQFVRAPLFLGAVLAAWRTLLILENHFTLAMENSVARKHRNAEFEY